MIPQSAEPALLFCSLTSMRLGRTSPHSCPSHSTSCSLSIAFEIHLCLQFCSQRGSHLSSLPCVCSRSPGLDVCSKWTSSLQGSGSFLQHPPCWSLPLAPSSLPYFAHDHSDCDTDEVTFTWLPCLLGGITPTALLAFAVLGVTPSSSVEQAGRVEP